MKTLTVVLVVTVLVIHISGYLIHVPTEPIIRPETTVPGQWLHFQKRIIPLFENVCEVSSDAVIEKLSHDFVPNSGDYLKPEVVTNLQKLISAGILPKGEIFTEYDPNHMNELKIIFEALYYAKDFDAFYKAAAWARQNVNCALYVNAIYLTIQSRKDTERLIIPAPYELLPNYFIEKDVIKQAASILAGKEVIPTDSVRDEGNAYHLDANYTALFYDNEDDSKLAYFREDIGLNSYYYLRKLKLLLPSFYEDTNCRYGENMYQMMKQFMARYNLERYANGLPEIDSIDWNSLSDIPYDPLLIYSDGNEFSHRTAPLQVLVNEDLTSLQTIENNLVAVVDHLRQSGYNKTQIMNHLMEILVTGDRSYETLARRLLGKDLPDNRHVSVLGHYMTSMRDPMFWRINKNIVELIDSALNTLPTYTRSELYFPGVNIVNIDVKKMMTAFDYFEFDVTDALKIDDSNTTFNVKIGQPRLNHKPFTIKLNISSLVSKKGLVKIYLGPKLMPGELAIKKNLFTLLDIFEINLKIGTNMISRSSTDMKHFSEDFMSLKIIRKIVEDAEYGLDFMLEKTIASQIGYPSRLILPKGSPLGLPLQMFVFVAPLTKVTSGDSYSTNNMEFNSAVLSPGYPLDLKIESKQLFELPNAMIKYVTVTQKKDSKVENYGGPGVTKQWYGTSTYDPSSRPTYSAKNREPFDYNSKKGPYDRTDSNLEKNNEYNVASQDVDYKNQGEELTTITYLLESNKVDSTEFESKKHYDSKEKIAENDKSEAKNEVDKDVEITLPRLLKSTKSDYMAKTKSKKQFEYKTNSQYDRNEYSEKYKNKHYYKLSTDMPPEEEVVPRNENQEPYVALPNILKPIELDDIASNFDKTNKAKDEKKESLPKKDKFSMHNVHSTKTDDVKQDEENEVNIKEPRLLKSSFDHSKYNRREKFDYQSKKAQFDKKDYAAKRGNYTKYRKTTPKEEDATTTMVTTSESEDEFARVMLNKDTNYLDLINEITANDINMDDIDDIQDSQISDFIQPDPEPTSDLVRTRIPTVYDFLFHVFDYIDSSEKVYE